MAYRNWFLHEYLPYSNGFLILQYKTQSKKRLIFLQWPLEEQDAIPQYKNIDAQKKLENTYLELIFHNYEHQKWNLK